MKTEKACHCHRDGTCRCEDTLVFTKGEGITSAHCKECGSYEDHCECGCTCKGSVVR